MILGLFHPSIHSSITKDHPGFFHLLTLPFFFCWVLLFGCFFPHGPKMAAIVLLNNSNPKLPAKSTCFHLGVFFSSAWENLSRKFPSKLSVLSCWPELHQMLIANPLIGRGDGNWHYWLRLELSNPGVRHPFVISLLEEAFFPMPFGSLFSRQLSFTSLSFCYSVLQIS